MKITADKTVNVNGFSLACYLPGVSMRDVFNTFPDARVEGYYEEERGYTEDEALFSTSDGDQFYVYSRWGDVRLGLAGGWSNDKVELIKAAFLAALGR